MEKVKSPMTMSRPEGVVKPKLEKIGHPLTEISEPRTSFKVQIGGHQQPGSDLICVTTCISAVKPSVVVVVVNC